MRRSRLDTRRRHRNRLSRYRRLRHEFLEVRLCLAVFVVNSPGDEPDLLPGDGQARTVSGTTTLRAAIMEANHAADKDTIKFAIPPDLPHVIQPVEALPTLTQPIIIDGYLDNPDASPNTNAFEQGSNAELDIVLDGSQAPAGINGLTLEGGNSVVRGLVIHSFQQNPSTGRNGFGIVLGVYGGNVVEGNFLGTDVTGLTAMPNTSGIALASANNTVGGTTDAARNVISGNRFNGIQIGSTRDGASTGGNDNRILGNYLGTTATGNRPLPNDNGIRITTIAGWNTIGGTTPGAANVLSGNRFQGILIDDDSSGHNLVQGNFIGTDPTGNVTDPDGTPDSGDELGNRDDGIDISGAPHNVIGGPTREAGNVISGNKGAGVLIAVMSATENVVQNNRIGTNAAGTISSILAHLGNGGDGVQIQGGSANLVEDNLISNNQQYGVGIFRAEATGNLVQGNLIGTDVTGTVAMGNEAGVAICDAPSNFIGGTRPNVISGNAMHGVYISGVGASGNFIQGNYIGTDVTGLGALANLFDGVRIADATRNYVGGSTAVTHNLISGNLRHGVHISGTGATGNVILNNTIGLDLTGENELGNDGNGVLIDGAPENWVGLGGGTRNVISGNHQSGILIQGENGHGNIVSGNFVGTNRAGTVAIGNGFDGISLVNVTSTMIGGDRETAGNLISGNGQAGVSIEGGSVNFVQGNRIGTDHAVAKSLANLSGVAIVDSDSNQIGGVHALLELRNVISGNLFEGIIIHGSEASGNIVNGNNIGTNTNATAALPNGSDGIKVSEAFGNEIGLPSASRAGNVIAGNLGFGVYVVDTSDTRIQNNLIGIGDGDVALPNVLGGVFLFKTEDDLVGGSREQGEANVISGNAAGPGVRVAMSHDSVVRGNFIGTNVSGTEPRPNLLGIKIEASWKITVGPSTTRHESNLISGNITDGILIDSAWNNAIHGNVIGLDLAREMALPNGGDGVRIFNGWDNVIGVDVDRDIRFQNVISGNLGNGLLIEGARSQRNAVRGNFIGTDGDGLLARGNGLFGIRLEHAAQNVIGGVRNPEGNLISGHRTDGGLGIRGGHDNIVQGNFIGTDCEGAGLIPNLDGVVLEDSYDNWIGVSPGLQTPDRGNLISGNSGSGVVLEGIAHGNRVMGNQIGVQKDGVNPLRNEEDGVKIDLGAFGNWIGWTGETDANTIAYNGGSGVVVASGEENVIRGNSIHDNAVLGVDLNDDGITVNDPLDSDEGANHLANFPNLIWANAGTLEIAGTLSAKPFTKYEIEFYSSPKPSPFGFGQGQSRLSSTMVTTNHLGRAVFSAKTTQLAVGDWITATAADADGNTSEFSAGVLVSDDGDDDGVSDDVEAQGPHGGDGNQDGIPDSQQPDVATLKNLTSGIYTTLVAGAGAALQAVQAVSDPPPPPGINLDLGLFSLRIVLPTLPPQASTTVTVIPASPVASNSYYQYGPTPDNPNPHWYDFLYDGQTGAEIVAGTITRFVLHFVDGARGDHDLTANGEILDPGGPASPIAPGLRITGSALPLPAFVGQRLAYSYTVTNHSPGTAADVSFTNALPRGVHFISASASSGATLEQSGGTVVGNLGPLPSGQSVDVTITMLLTDSGEMLSTATVSSSVTELDLSDNTLTLVTHVSPAPMTLPRETDLAVTATATSDPVGVGGDLTYTLTVTNQGPDTAQGIVLSDTLPAEVQLVSVTGTRTLPPPDNQPLRIRFDYSHDTGYFNPDTWEYFPPVFDSQEKMDLLEMAADYVLQDLRDDLAAIVPAGENHWTATFTDPASGQDAGVEDLEIAANELLVFVGGRDLGGFGSGMLEGGVAGPGGSVAWGSAEFVNAVRTRGEVGASWPAPGDFGPWGGSIAFNLNPAAKFHFGDTLDGLDADELDFLSVAMHELGHVLGIGTSPAWQVRSDSLSGTFRGSFARAAYDAGGAVPLDPELVHWRTDTTDQGDPALMDPVIEAGTREWPTPLDLAALRDIGWGDVPQSRDVPVPYISSGGTVTFDVGELRVGESVTAKIVVRPTQVGTATNSARVTSPGADQNQSNNTVQVTTQVDPCPPLVVNSDWDIDDGVSDGRTTTLREAIRLANLLPGKNTISFDLPRGRAIFVDAPLPTITDPVVIDGTTQPGYAGAPIVSLNGPYWQQAGYTGLHITAGDSVVRGLRINYFLQVSPSGSITGGNGILLEDGGGNIIQGNYLGPHQGSVLGNDTAGIAIVHSDGNRIGGTTPEARNVISGNHNAGILLYESRDNIIVGNYIGTDAEGLHAVPNGVGIALFGSHHNRIGGTAPGAGNVISGNRENGIEVAWRYAWFSGSNSNVLEGNYIGVAADGTTPCGNGLHGIQLYSGAHNIVGGRDPLAANTIAFNGGAGVAYTDSVTRNQILGNSMDSNGGLGIDRWPAGVTETPPYYYFYASPDFPSLTYALSDADTTRIRGTLKSLANTTFELDFYTSAAADPSGHGEGQAWLGTATVTTDALGLAPFYLSFPRSTPAGQFIAATSTGQISTSEFSNSVVVQADRDGDGVADVEEDGGPYSGDADRDGTLDSLQTDVATLRNSGDQQYVTLKSAAGSTLDGVWAIENPSPGNSPYAIPFPLGFFDGVVEDVAAGGSTTVTLLMPAGVVPHSFYQFGAAAGSTSDFWYEFPFDGTTGAEIFPDRVVLHYVDGGRGDHDLEMNRRISFRGGVSGPPAMHVVDTIPAQNDGQAPQDAQVSATFGEDVDPATVSDQTFFVHGAESGQFVVPPNALGVDRATASLTPARPFHPGERVAITATRAIHSADGDTPVAPFSWEFRAAVAGGTATFAESTVEHFGFPETYGVAMKDLDGDGDPDVFLANALPEPSSVWLNNGSGNGHFIDTGQQLGPFDGRDVALDDLDGDGDVDAFVATYGHGNRVFLNDGRGYFTDSSQRLGNALTMGISLGDLDADGDLDAFVANAHGQSNSVWLNDGHALFTDSGQSLGSGDSRDVALGDLDADGDLDAFTADFDRPGEVWLNDGQGRFANSGQQIGSVGNRNVALGDVNGDGSLDAFLVGTDLDAVWLNDGRGQFTGTDAFQNLQDCLGGAAVDVADFDRDGDLDALVARRPSGSYNEGTLWVNVGQGRFVAARWTYGSNYASQGTSTGGQAVADVDGDGDFDAIVANDLGWEGRTMLLENHASAYGISIGGGGIEQSFTRTGVWASAAADMDSDGDLDLVFAQAAGMQVWFNNGRGDYTPSAQRMGRTTDPVLGDLNNDGTIDILVVAVPSSYDYRVKVWLNDGLGHFTDTGSEYPVGEGDHPIRLGDMDGDGDLDAVFVQRCDGCYNELWLNDGSGHFTDSGRRLGGGYVDRTSDIGLGDLDGDGDLDAYLTNPGRTIYGQTDNVWLNDGHGRFSDSGWRPTPGSSTGVRLADLDGNGDLDVFLTRAYYGGGSFYFREEVWFNDGHGRFSDSGQRLERRIQETSWYGDEVAELGDLDGDGDLDALVGRWVWLNDGQGRFSESPQQLAVAEEIPQRSSVANVTMGDVDSDGDVDAVLTHGNVRWAIWLNQDPDQINHPPVTAVDGYLVDQDTSLAASPAGVLANDSEPDGQTLTAALVTAPRYAASFEFRADGSFKYTPHRGFSGPDSFAYEARDPLGLATTATVSLFVVPGTAAPVARDDFATTTPGVPVAIDVTANDSDRGGFVDPATIAFLSEPTLGQASVDPDTGVVTYVPHPAFMGTDRFSYQITGPTGLTDSAVITIEILPVNKPPTAENDAATTDEGAPVAIDVTANDRDADGNLDPSSVRIVLAPANGTARVAPATGMVQYVPGVGFFGEDMFTYEVCDTHGASARARVTLTVVSRPDAPLAGDDAAQTRINQAVTVPVLANDSDADEDLVPGTLRVWNGPLHGRATVDGSTGTITYEPLANFVGSDQFTYEVCDATAFCDTATVTIHVTNAPPVAVDDAANTPEAVPVNIDLTGNDGDPDGNLDPRSVRILISPLGATVTLDPQTGVATYIPRSGFSGVDLFAYEISDTTGAYGPPAIGSVHIMVTPVNDPPQAQDDTMFALPDTPIDLDVLGNDNDVDSLIDRATVTIEEGPSSGSVVAQVDGSVRYTPRTGFTGTDQFRYTVQDDAGARSNVAVVTITVQAAPPMLVVGRVFEDTDQDGPGLEGTGIAGQLIYLLNGQAQLLATTLTQADDPATPEDETGWYHFPDLAPGTYVVAEQRMAGWRQSHPQDTGIRLPDLAVHPGLYVITLSPSHALDVLDFGTFPSSAAGYASISGRVYLDVDNDGVCDPPELGVPNVPITIDGPVTRVVVTDADGCYRAGDLPAGRYTITETQPLVFLDGRETAGAPQPGSVANDCFLDVELLPDMQGEEYNFGEYGLKAQFIGKHLYLASTPPTNVFLAQLQVTSGESLLAFTAPKDGTLCATAMLEGESQPVQLYNEHWRPVSLSAPAGTLRAPVTGGDSYLMYVGSRGTTVVNVALSPVVAAEPVFVFTNNVRAEDVNADGCVSPRDALLVINALNATGSRYLAGVNLSANYIDVSDDDYLSPIDALMVINRLNRVPDRGEGEGGAEGEGWPVELPARWLVIDSVGALMRDVAERAPSPGRASAASPVVESVWLPRGEEPWPAHRRLRDRALWEYLIETATQRAPALDDMIDMLLHPCKSRTS